MRHLKASSGDDEVESRYSTMSDTPSVYSPASFRARIEPQETSMLDLSDDPRASVVSQDSLDGALDSRMSMLGPKMRFHSPAPWEEADELSDEDAAPRKAFPFASSPRSSNDSRPSAESSRLPSKLRKSPDATPSRGALQAIVEAGVNTSFSHKLPASRYPSAQSPSSPHSASFSYFSSSSRSARVERSPSPHYDDDSRRSTIYDEPPHPFANPDFAHIPNETPRSPARSTFSADPAPFNDSSSTVVHDYSNYRSTADYRAYDNRSLTSSSGQRWEISSPLPIKSGSRFSNEPSEPEAPPVSDVNNLPGWSGQTSAPSFHLISLEEARAQRSRSATADSASISSASVPFPPLENTAPDGNRFASTGRSRARSISAGAKAKTALQSIVGSAAPPPMPERRDSEPSTPIYPVSGMNSGNKSLKHKTSGFMRLFNGQRAKDERPPPVPALSEAYAVMNSHNNSNLNNYPSKFTGHQISVPQNQTGLLDPSLHSDDRSSGQGSSNSSSTKRSSSPRRTPPALSIRTGSPADITRGPNSTINEPLKSRALSSGPGKDRQREDNAPQSAPANVLEFPPLRLRPVSTVFSAKFGDEFVTRDSQPSLEADLGTPSSTSPTSAMSPITPGLYQRSLGAEKSERANAATPPTSSTDDQSAIIQALQEQIVTAKKAWQRHIWELEGQVRDLKAEVEDLRAAGSFERGYCDACGRGDPALVPSRPTSDTKPSVVNRPRARTGISSSRFGAVM